MELGELSPQQGEPQEAHLVQGQRGQLGQEELLQQQQQPKRRKTALCMSAEAGPTSPSVIIISSDSLPSSVAPRACLASSGSSRRVGGCALCSAAASGSWAEVQSKTQNWQQQQKFLGTSNALLHNSSVNPCYSPPGFFHC